MTSQHKSPAKFSMVEGPVGPILVRLTLPMVLAITVMMSFDAVDTFFVAQLGVQQLAAISFTVPVGMLFMSVSIGLSTGATTEIAREIGRKNENMARRITTDAVLLSCVLSVFMAILGWYCNDMLFTKLGAEGPTLDYIRDYMSIWYFGVPGLIVPMVCLSALRAKGMNKLQSYILMASVLVNVILDPLLIFGIGWFPRLDIQGAALATVISRWASLFIVYYLLHFRLQMFAELWVGWTSFLQSIKRVLHVGLPATATHLIIPVAGNIVLALVASYGTAAVAGYGVALRVEVLALTVFFALSGVIGPFFGQNVGAQAYDRLSQALHAIAKFSVFWGGAMALLLWTCGHIFAGVFTSSADALSVTTTYFMIVPLSYIGYGLVMSVNAAFNGLAKPLPGLLLSSGRVIVVLLPLIWLFRQFWGLEGIFIAIALSNLALAVVGFIWLQRAILKIKSQSDANLQPQDY